MSLNNSNQKYTEKSELKIEEHIYNRLAVELCAEIPNKSKIKKLCAEGKILFSGDIVDLMSTVLIELSEFKKHKSR